MDDVGAVRVYAKERRLAVTPVAEVMARWWGLGKGRSAMVHGRLMAGENMKKWIRVKLGDYI